MSNTTEQSFLEEKVTKQDIVNLVVNRKVDVLMASIVPLKERRKVIHNTDIPAIQKELNDLVEVEHMKYIKDNFGKAIETISKTLKATHINYVLGGKKYKEGDPKAEVSYLIARMADLDKNQAIVTISKEPILHNHLRKVENRMYGPYMPMGIMPLVFLDSSIRIDIPVKESPKAKKLKELIQKMENEVKELGNQIIKIEEEIHEAKNSSQKLKDAITEEILSKTPGGLEILEKLHTISLGSGTILIDKPAKTTRKK